MTFNLLISCMHQEDASIIERSNVQSDVVIVNQCNIDSVEEFDFTTKTGKVCHAKYICTTERGLSRSRNMAIRNAWGDICQVCDDDERIQDDNERVILDVYEKNPDAGLIAFSLIRKDSGKAYPTKPGKLKFIQILKTSSQQITFNRNKVISKGISFDEKMGSGTGNGAGEENKFILDCKRKGLILLYDPGVIATVNPGESQWFHGYDERYFENLGWTDRRLFGPIIGFAYLIYWPIFRHSEFRNNDITIWKAIKHSIIGFFSKR